MKRNIETSLMFNKAKLYFLLMPNSTELAKVNEKR